MQPRVRLIPTTEAELKSRRWREQKALNFGSCHPVSKSHFDTHPISRRIDQNYKRAEEYTGDFFFPLISKLNQLTLKSGASRRRGGSRRERTRRLPFCSSKPALDDNCKAASPVCFITKGISLHLLRPYSCLFSCSFPHFPFFLT